MLPNMSQSPIDESSSVSNEPRSTLTLSYADARLRPAGRPKILIALGLAAFLVGGTSIIANKMAFKPAYRMYNWSEPGPPEPKASPLTPYTGDYVGRLGLPKAQRERVLKTVETKGPLISDRREMFDRLLADAGKAAFGELTGDSPITILERTRENDGPDGKNFGPDVIRTGLGRIDLNVQSATFTAADGRKWVESLQSFTEPGQSPRWSAAPINEALDRVHRAQPQLNALQAAGLAAELAKSDPSKQEFVYLFTRNPGLAPPDWAPAGLSVSSALPGGAFQGSFGRSEFWVLPDGRVVYPAPNMRWDPAIGLRRADGRVHLPIPRWAAGIAVAECFASGVLAVLLLLASVAIMASSRWSRSLLRTYAVLKLWVAGVTILASFVVLSQWGSIAKVAASYDITLPKLDFLVTQGILSFLIWILFPVLVLLVLRARSVETWYHPAGLSAAGARNQPKSRALVLITIALSVIMAGANALLLAQKRDLASGCGLLISLAILVSGMIWSRGSFRVSALTLLLIATIGPQLAAQSSLSNKEETIPELLKCLRQSNNDDRPRCIASLTKTAEILNAALEQLSPEDSDIRWQLISSYAIRTKDTSRLFEMLDAPDKETSMMAAVELRNWPKRGPVSNRRLSTLRSTSDLKGMRTEYDRDLPTPPPAPEWIVPVSDSAKTEPMPIFQVAITSSTFLLLSLWATILFLRTRAGSLSSGPFPLQTDANPESRVNT